MSEAQMEKETSASALVSALRPLLYTQTRMIDRLLHRLSGAEGSLPPALTADVTEVTVMMIHALGVSTHSILRLTDSRDMALRDCFGIARSISELAVNIGYIASVGPDAARRARLHALQKAYRDLDRNGMVGGFGFTIKSGEKPEVSAITGLAEALAEFTRANGREITEWTPLSVSERIEVIKAHHPEAALSLAGSVTSVYRHSSELLHGTYFGIVHFWRASGELATTRQRFSECWDEHFFAIFSAAYFGAQGVIEVFSKLLDLPDLVDAQRRLNTELAGKLSESGLVSPPLQAQTSS